MGFHLAEVGVKINFACGRRVLPGYYNIDAVADKSAMGQIDLLYEMGFSAGGCLLDRMPVADCAASEIMAVHFLEHVAQHEVPAVLAEWRRVLCRGGRLVLELPDLLKCCANLILLIQEGRLSEVRQMAMWGIYGDDPGGRPYMRHKWGWWPEALRGALMRAGYVNIEFETPQWHRAGRDNRDMRAVAYRPI